MRFLTLFSLLPLLAEGMVNLDEPSQDSVDEVDLAAIKNFDISAFNEPPFKSRRDADPAHVLRRSTDSALVCRQITPLPATGGKWLYRQATCLYPFTPSSRFAVDCQAETAPAQIKTGLHGNCNTKDSHGYLVRRMCFQNHGYNEVGSPVSDIVCADPKASLKWSIPSGANHRCSHRWVNRGAKSAQVELVINVLDSTQSYGVSPGNVWFQVNGLKDGVEKSDDAYVTSGRVTVSPGFGIEACVAPKAGQILTVYGTLKALKWL